MIWLFVKLFSPLVVTTTTTTTTTSSTFGYCLTSNSFWAISHEADLQKATFGICEAQTAQHHNNGKWVHNCSQQVYQWNRKTCLTLWTSLIKSSDTLPQKVALNTVLSDSVIIMEPNNNTILTLQKILLKTYTFSKMARAAEVHNLYCTAFRVAEQNIFWFEVAVNDVEFGRSKEHQSHTQLLCKLSRQVQRHASKVGVAQQVVEVVWEQLKDETEMGTEHEVPLQSHYNIDNHQRLNIHSETSKRI